MNESECDIVCMSVYLCSMYGCMYMCVCLYTCMQAYIVVVVV